MISVLIPIYDFDVRDMVRDLHAQLAQENVAFEIRCYDDCSSVEFKKNNHDIVSLSNVIYRELPENIGRSSIRNLLAEEAAYHNLLFLDCDGELASKNFIKNYLNAITEDGVIYGGRSYHPNPPADRSKYLRWLYGIKRECTPYHERQIHPHKSFMTNNFMMSRDQFLSIKLNEAVKGYGHEDTLFGIELKNRGIQIKHIDNPLIHIGLEDSETFLEKTSEGVRNLHRLVQEGLLPGKEVKLWVSYNVLRKTRLDKVTYKQFKKRRSKVIEQLKSDEPSLKNFDFFKLGVLLECYLDK